MESCASREAGTIDPDMRKQLLFLPQEQRYMSLGNDWLNDSLVCYLCGSAIPRKHFWGREKDIVRNLVTNASVYVQFRPAVSMDLTRE